MCACVRACVCVCVCVCVCACVCLIVCLFVSVLSLNVLIVYIILNNIIALFVKLTPKFNSH